MDRDQKLLLFFMGTLAIDRAKSVQFWQAFLNDEHRVDAVHKSMGEELVRLANELWPGH